MTTEDENSLIANRRGKLDKLRENGQAYPNHFRPSHLAGDIKARFESMEKSELDAQSDDERTVTIAGRMMTRRVMGKNSFAHVRDVSGSIQIMVARDELPWPPPACCFWSGSTSGW